MKSQFLIGATSSGSGKTTLTLGLLRAFKNKGLKVQPFKCGPDYIDTKFHELAADEKAINLDLFLSSESYVRKIYAKYASESDVAITEGVMGLFDGYNKMKGSSAEVAISLDLPVILVLNAKSMAYSAAPLLYGFKNFCPDIRIAGVILNRVNTESHYSYLKDACQEVGIIPLGYLPENKELEIPSRHLGLSIDKDFLFDEFADKTARFIEKQVDLDRLLEVTASKNVKTNPTAQASANTSLKIAVASDEAFNFYYHENIAYLKSIGEVSFFSPLKDRQLPDTDLVYLPGGYPELHLEELSDNTSMQNSIREYVRQGGKLFAECGGMMYLSSAIKDKEGKEYPMVDVFKQTATMENMKLHLGYRQFDYNGVNMRGHEFHYSSVSDGLESTVPIFSATERPVKTKLLRYKNAIAGYTHLYWAETGSLMELFK